MFRGSLMFFFFFGFDVYISLFISVLCLCS